MQLRAGRHRESTLAATVQHHHTLCSAVQGHNKRRYRSSLVSGTLEAPQDVRLTHALCKSPCPQTDPFATAVRCRKRTCHVLLQKQLHAAHLVSSQPRSVPGLLPAAARGELSTMQLVMYFLLTWQLVRLSNSAVQAQAAVQRALRVCRREKVSTCGPWHHPRQHKPQRNESCPGSWPQGG